MNEELGGHFEEDGTFKAGQTQYEVDAVVQHEAVPWASDMAHLRHWSP